MSAEPSETDDDDDAFAREFAKTKAENDANNKARGPKRKRFTPEDSPPDFAAADKYWWPTTKQYEEWWTFVLPGLGMNDEGWWWGFCPKHDKSKHPEFPTAQFNFKAGAIRCWGHPSPCWGGHKGATTLTNLRDQLRNKRGC